MLKLCLFVAAFAVVFGKHVPPCEQVDQFNDYTIVMFQDLIKLTKENIAISSYAAGKLLALIALGARGDTAKQIKSVVNLVGSDRDIKNWFRGLTLEKNTVQNLEVESSLTAYFAECIAIEPDFRTLATDYFEAGIQNVDFYDPEQTALNINTFVANRTNNNINHVIDEDDISALTRFIMVNVLYFSGEFLYPFPVAATEKVDFYSSKTECSPVDMMTITGNYLLSKHPDLGATMLYIPFKNQRAKIVILLPDDIERAEFLQNNVLSIWHSRNFSLNYVQIFLPRFRIESTIRFKSILEIMGITNLFHRPDLSGITREEIAVSEIFQRAVIDINEFGAGVESASNVGSVPQRPPGHKEEPFLFKVDRPFVYCILYDGLGLVDGRVNKL